MSTTDLSSMNLDNLDFSDETAIVMSAILLVAMMAISMLISVVSSLIVFVMYYVIIAAVSAALNFPIFRMAQRAGVKNAWITFIPPLHLYIQLQLAKREFNLFDKYKTADRKKVFKHFLMITVLFALIHFVFMFFSMIAFVIGSITVIGLVIVMVVAMLEFVLLMGAYILYVYLIAWRTTYDVFLTYGLKEEDAKLYSILGCFIPLVTTIYGYILMDKEPDYTV